MPIPQDSFSPIYQQALSTYRMISAVRKLQLPRGHLDPLSDSGNRINLEMMLSDSRSIDDNDYLLQPEDDHIMELNRLRIIGSIYDMVFRNISIASAAARMKFTDLEKETGYEAISSPRVSEFLSSILTIQNEASCGKYMLIEGKTKEYVHNAKLNDIISSVAVVMDAFYRQSKIELEVVLSEKDIQVEGRPRDIKQALMNILMAKSYALRNTEKAKVTLGGGNYGNFAVIYIVDNGPRIPHPDANMIFHAAENATERGWKYDIAMAERSITSHGGEVRAKNTNTGVEEKIILPGTMT